MKLPKKVESLADVVGTLCREHARNYLDKYQRPIDTYTMKGACAAVSNELVKAINWFGFGKAHFWAFDGSDYDISSHCWSVVEFYDAEFVVDLTFRQFKHDAPWVHSVEVGTPEYTAYLHKVAGFTGTAGREAQEKRCRVGRGAYNVARQFVVGPTAFSEVTRRMRGMFS